MCDNIIRLGEIILSFVFGEPSKLDSVMRTMVIAVEAGETSLVVQPCGHFAMSPLDVVDRTDIGTDSAPDTFVLVYPKAFVCNQLLHEEPAYDMTLESGTSASLDMEYILVA